jgi:hypothetical protein
MRQSNSSRSRESWISRPVVSMGTGVCADRGLWQVCCFASARFKAVRPSSSREKPRPVERPDGRSRPLHFSTTIGTISVPRRPPDHDAPSASSIDDLQGSSTDNHTAVQARSHRPQFEDLPRDVEQGAPPHRLGPRDSSAGAPRCVQFPSVQMITIRGWVQVRPRPSSAFVIAWLANHAKGRRRRAG